MFLTPIDPHIEGSWKRFLKRLEEGRITNPDKYVLDRITERYYNAIDAAGSSVERAVNFYRMVKLIPGTKTVAIIANQLSLHINGPIREYQPNILTACDRSGGLFVLKLLSIDNGGLQYKLQHKEIFQEEETCKILSLEEPHVGLCKIDVLKVNLGFMICTALKMKWYIITLEEHPKTFPEQQIKNAKSLSTALEYMHGKGIVHMDIKASNIFISDTDWVIGDFGSSKPIGDCVTSSNLIMFRSGITQALPKYDWLMLLLVFLRETLDDRKKWIQMFCINDKLDDGCIEACIQNVENSDLKSILLDFAVKAEIL